MHTIRSFISLPLSTNVISHLKKVQNQLMKYRFNVNWVKPDNIHITLKFLGDIDSEQIKKVKQVINQISLHQKTLVLKIKGMGVFPGIKSPRVIWAGITGDTNSLLQLQQNLDANLVNAGFQPEKRQFKAHVTLGRIKGKIDPKNLLNAIYDLRESETQEFVINKLNMYKSDLTTTGPVYTKIISADFNQLNRHA